MSTERETPERVWYDADEDRFYDTDDPRHGFVEYVRAPQPRSTEGTEGPGYFTLEDAQRAIDERNRRVATSIAGTEGERERRTASVDDIAALARAEARAPDFPLPVTPLGERELVEALRARVAETERQCWAAALDDERRPSVRKFAGIVAADLRDALSSAPQRAGTEGEALVEWAEDALAGTEHTVMMSRSVADEGLALIRSLASQPATPKDTEDQPKEN